MKRKIQVFIQPDAKVRGETRLILKNFAKKYNAYKAYNDWKGPHITVFTMEADREKLDRIVAELKRIIKRLKPFKVHINSTGYFMKSNSSGRRNYVLYLKVKNTRELNKLWSILNKNFRKYRTSFPTYVPHLTITSEDLDKKAFYAALKKYKNFKFSRDFKVKAVKVSAQGKYLKKSSSYNVKLHL